LPERPPMGIASPNWQCVPSQAAVTAEFEVAAVRRTNDKEKPQCAKLF
jgi:hypothetical protein